MCHTDDELVFENVGLPNGSQAPAGNNFPDLFTPAEGVPATAAVVDGHFAPAMDKDLSALSVSFERGTSTPATSRGQGVFASGCEQGKTNTSRSFGCERDMSAGDSRTRHLKRHLYMKFLGMHHC